LLLVLLLTGVGVGLVLLILAARRSLPRPTPDRRAARVEDAAPAGTAAPGEAARRPAGRRALPPADAPLDELVRRLRVELGRLSWEPLHAMAAERAVARAASMTRDELIDAIVDVALGGRANAPRRRPDRAAPRERRVVPRRRRAAAAALA
jgi:hypothetical protein